MPGSGLRLVPTGPRLEAKHPLGLFGVYDAGISFKLATNLDPTPEISLDQLDSWLSESGGRLSEQEGLVAFEICFKRQNVGLRHIARGLA